MTTLSKVSPEMLVDGLTPEEFLIRRFAKDVCLDCGRGASGHELEIDRWGDPDVRCVDRWGYLR